MTGNEDLPLPHAVRAEWVVRHCAAGRLLPMSGLSSSPSYMASPMYVSPPAAQSVRYPIAIGTGPLGSSPILPSTS